MYHMSGIDLLRVTLSSSVATLLLLQVVVFNGSLLQNADAQGLNFPTRTVGPGGYKVQIEYIWINNYHTLPPDPPARSDQEISFRSNATVLYTFLNFFAGNGTGHYRDTSYQDSIEQHHDTWCDPDSHDFLLEGEAFMDVKIYGDISEVQVYISGQNLTRIENDRNCGATLTTSSQDGEASGYCGFSNVDLERGGSYKSDDYLDYSDDDDRMEQGCLMVIVPLAENLDVRVDHRELHLEYVLDQNNVKFSPHAKVTVTLTTGGMPMKDKVVVIKVCTLPGTVTTDGHVGHDIRAANWEKTWKEPCDPGRRPAAELISRRGISGTLIVERTDNNGQILLDYLPPKHGSYQYIAGTDEITATALENAPALQDKETIVTKVPDLLPMPGSSNCNGVANYKFAAQSGSKHGCIFYGTADTNLALQRIGDEFMQRQQDCNYNPASAACQVSYSGSLRFVTIIGSPQPMRINAMGLPWGGLTDNVGGVPWKPPHASHNDGRQVDLSFGIFKKTGVSKGNPLCANLGPKCADYDIDRIMLLRDVIQNSSNFYRFPSYEGENLAATFRDKAPHIHIFFHR